jgi:hypothetical protein
MSQAKSEAMRGNRNAVKKVKATEKIHFSITATEKTAWQSYAEQHGLPLAKLIKRCVNREIEHDKQDDSTARN